VLIQVLQETTTTVAAKAEARMLEKSASTASVVEVKMELNESLFSQRMKFDSGIRQNKDLVDRQLLEFKADMREREVKEVAELQNKFHALNSAFENNRAQSRIDLSVQKVELEKVQLRIILGVLGGLVATATLSVGVARLIMVPGISDMFKGFLS
jgi:hypothetical protein